MKTNLEKQLQASRTEAEKLIKAELGDDALEIICSFSDLECVIDVKVADEAAWRRYLLLENGDDEDCEIRRIG